MKRIRFRWRDREREGILVNESSEYLEIKLRSGYNVVLDRNEVEILHEEGIEIERPKVIEEEGDYSVIMTGGTIMSRVDYITGAVYPSYDLSEIIQRPSKKISLSEIKFSEAMEPRDWQEISELCYRELKDGKRVIVLHGTDTMTYSSSAVAFAIREMNSPVVFVGAQRSSDRPSSDQSLNIRGAFRAADTDIGESVIVMHDTLSDKSVGIFRGVRTRKSHSSRRDAFRAIGQGKIARILYPEEKVVIEEKYKEITDLGELKGRFSYDVGILYFYPGMDEDVLEYFAKRFRGIVLVGTGLGHVAPKLIPKIAEYRDKVFVITTQTIDGRVNLNVYRTGREMLDAGVLGNLTDILPEVAYVKLSWMFGNGIPKEMYEKNIVGEITERSAYSSGA